MYVPGGDSTKGRIRLEVPDIRTQPEIAQVLIALLLQRTWQSPAFRRFSRAGASSSGMIPGFARSIPSSSSSGSGNLPIPMANEPPSLRTCA